MVELRTTYGKHSKLDATWEPAEHAITIRNPHLRIDTTYYLHEDGTYSIKTVPLKRAS